MSAPLRSLERVLRVMVAVLALAVALAANYRAHAAPSLNWLRAHDVQEVSIEIKQVTRTELNALLRKYDHEPKLAPPKVFGFSLLMRNQRTGSWRCELYVLLLDDRETIEHETRHCNGWVHP